MGKEHRQSHSRWFNDWISIEKYSTLIIINGMCLKKKRYHYNGNTIADKMEWVCFSVPSQNTYSLCQVHLYILVIEKWRPHPSLENLSLGKRQRCRVQLWNSVMNCISYSDTCTKGHWNTQVEVINFAWRKRGE